MYPWIMSLLTVVPIFGWEFYPLLPAMWKFAGIVIYGPGCVRYNLSPEKRSRYSRFKAWNHTRLYNHAGKNRGDLQGNKGCPVTAFPLLFL